MTQDWSLWLCWTPFKVFWTLCWHDERFSIPFHTWVLSNWTVKDRKLWPKEIAWVTLVFLSLRVTSKVGFSDEKLPLSSMQSTGFITRPKDLPEIQKKMSVFQFAKDLLVREKDFSLIDLKWSFMVIAFPLCKGSHKNCFWHS